MTIELLGRIARRVLASRALAATASGLFVLMLVGGVALATIPDSTGTITGCYSRTTGALRVINSEAGKHCKTSELKVKWSQQGPKGDQGLQGIQGLKGDQGLQGLKGDTGAQGLKGDQGIQGLQGDQGIQGLQGDQGLQGLKGDTGAQGLKGDQGIQGIQGLQGAKGDTGLRGPTGLTLVGGSAVFVDALDTTGYIGLGGEQWLASSDADAAAPFGAAGTLTSFNARGSAIPATKTVTLTVTKNGAATTVSCQLVGTAAASVSCADSTHTVAFLPTDTLSVKVDNPSTHYVRNLRWTAGYS